MTSVIDAACLLAVGLAVLPVVWHHRRPRNGIR